MPPTLPEQIAELNKNLDAATARIAFLEKENAALAAKEQSIEARATAKADEIMAGVGFFNPTPSPKGSEASHLTGIARAKAALTQKK